MKAELLLLVLLGVLLPSTQGRLITKVLTLDNGLEWGEWGPVQYCDEGSFANVMEVKFEPYSVIDVDETAVTGVKLSCAALSGMTPTNNITSSFSSKGRWQGERPCTSGFLTGMQAQVLEPQGTFSDDVAVQNLLMTCDYGAEVLEGVQTFATRIPAGSLSQWAHCDADSAICGLETRMEDPSLVVDDTGINDITMYCCALSG